MKPNETLIRISSGYIPTNQHLELGSDIMVALKGTVVKEEKHDNQDGTYDLVYVVKVPDAYDVEIKEAE